MTAFSVEFLADHSTEAQIEEHLRACQGHFIPPLEERVDLQQYARKIRARAMTFEAWSEGTLVGLVAAYFDAARRTGFVTSVSVLPAFAGRGLASELLQRCLQQARDTAVLVVSLEVAAQSTAALRLYAKAGFSETSRRGDTLFLERVID